MEYNSVTKESGKKGILSLIAGIAVYAVIIVLTVLAIRNVAVNYRSLETMDLSKDATGSIVYFDHLYGALAHGIMIDHNDINKNVQLTEFLQSSMQSIDKRILSCGILYIMMTVVVLSYWLYCKFGHSRKTHTLSIIASVAVLYAFYVCIVVITHKIHNVPFYFLSASDTVILIASILSVVGGSCFLAWILRSVRFKRTTAVIAIPVVFMLFIIGTSFEGQLCSPATVDSFDYVEQEIEPRIYDENFEGEVYYDQTKNVLVLNGKEYGPRQVENPNYLTGAVRYGGYLFEIVSPYSGCGLFLILDAAELSIAPFILVLYVLKALVLLYYYY